MKLTITRHDRSGVPSTTHPCPWCPFIAKNATGLSSHTRKHRLPDGTFPTRQAEGITVLEADAGAPADGFPDAVHEPADPDMAAAEARLLHELEQPGALDTPYQAGLRAIRDQDARAITPPQLDATGDFIAPAEQRRRATKEPRQQEPVNVGSRRCKGSATFGIEAHDAPLADFPVQPSRKDGLGVMCKTHWREYTNALRHRAEAAQGAPAPAPSTDDAPSPSKRAQRPAQAPTVDPALAAAAALIQDVDALPADEYVKRVAQDDVQAALALVARTGAGEVAPAE